MKVWFFIFLGVYACWSNTDFYSPSDWQRLWAPLFLTALTILSVCKLCLLRKRQQEYTGQNAFTDAIVHQYPKVTRCGKSHLRVNCDAESKCA